MFIHSTVSSFLLFCYYCFYFECTDTKSDQVNLCLNAMDQFMTTSDGQIFIKPESSLTLFCTNSSSGVAVILDGPNLGGSAGIVDGSGENPRLDDTILFNQVEGIHVHVSGGCINISAYIPNVSVIPNNFQLSCQSVASVIISLAGKYVCSYMYMCTCDFLKVTGPNKRIKSCLGFKVYHTVIILAMNR